MKMPDESEPAIVVEGDCLPTMGRLAPGCIDSIVTDPPYGLEFMGKGWDRGVPGERFWRAAIRTLRPGGYMLAMGGTRTFHRLACAIEDAGFEMRDTLAWLYGSGFPKGKGCLKPAWEPILLCRKPGPKVLPLGVDACRVGFASDADKASAFPGGKVTSHGSGSLAGPGAAQDAERTEFAAERNSLGRWPANVAHDGCDEVMEAFAVFGSEKGASGKVTVRNADKFRNTFGDFAGSEEHAPFYGDTGTAARFFYCAKASRADREEGLGGMPVGLPTDDDKWATNDRRAGTDRQPTEWKKKPTANRHPTVKPTALMRWLVKLVTPPGGVILDPFAGSGSTGKAAALEGFRFVGIEQDASYVAIARRRIAAARAESPLYAESK